MSLVRKHFHVVNTWMSTNEKQKKSRKITHHSCFPVCGLFKDLFTEADLVRFEPSKEHQ